MNTVSAPLAGLSAVTVRICPSAVRTAVPTLNAAIFCWVAATDTPAEARQEPFSQ